MGFLAQHLPACADKSMETNNNHEKIYIGVCVFVQKNVLLSSAKENDTDGVFGTTPANVRWQVNACTWQDNQQTCFDINDDDDDERNNPSL